MGSITVLDEADLRSVVGLDTEEMAVIRAVYPLITSGQASMPPIMRLDVPRHRGEIDVKSAYLPDHPAIAVKMSAGFFDNPSRGLPSLGGLMVLFDATTGIPLAVLFDNGYLTDLRTALAGAVAAALLARPESSTAALVGAGAQARMQLEALLLVREIERCAVWARDPAKASAFADRAAADLGVEVTPASSVESAATSADVVVTATPSTEALVDDSMLRAGTHVTAVGADAEHKRELSSRLVLRARPFVCDSITQSARLGELRAPLGEGLAVDAVELGQVVIGAAGRNSADAITVCDLTGTGAQDTAIAGLAYRRCVAAGLGTTVDT